MKRDSFYSLSGERVCLPYSWKTYFDEICVEWANLNWEEKVLHIGFAVSQGLDLRHEIIEYLDDHDYINRDTVKRTLCKYIALLRFGDSKKYEEEYNATYIVLDRNMSKLDDVIELLRIEFKLRIGGEFKGKDVEFIRKYIAPPYTMKLFNDEENMLDIVTHPTGYKKVTEEDIRKENHWPGVGERCYNRYDLFTEEPERYRIYPEDEDILEAFNKKAGNKTKYYLGCPAEPWHGNPLNASVVILSLNPGFIPGVNDVKAQQFGPAQKEAIWMEMRSWLELSQGASFMPINPLTFEVMDELGDHYWTNKLRPLLKEYKMDDVSFYREIALLQLCAYSSEKYADFPKGTVLPSQQLTKDIIRYIAYEKPETQFVLMRGEPKWKELLDADVWETIQPRLIVNKNYLVQSVSRGNLGDANFEKILKVLNR